jgi:hypothetical protein
VFEDNMREAIATHHLRATVHRSLLAGEPIF